MDPSDIRQGQVWSQEARYGHNRYIMTPQTYLPSSQVPTRGPTPVFLSESKKVFVRLPGQAEHQISERQHRAASGLLSSAHGLLLALRASLVDWLE